MGSKWQSRTGTHHDTWHEALKDLIWRLFAALADLHVSHGSSLRRMSAWPRERIVFEDIHAARNMTCPSCKEDREPIRHLRMLAGSSPVQASA
ncbi:MAG TPA: hypothetical protein VEW04_08130 [Allosphingosinicella sp.]|nr:hypothetical protein [Allosphingosinicella sp.]